MESDDSRKRQRIKPVPDHVPPELVRPFPFYTAIEEFLAAIPEFRITPGVEVESWLGGMITPIALPLSW